MPAPGPRERSVTFPLSSCSQEHQDHLITQQQEYEFPVVFHTVFANLPGLCLRAPSSLPTSSSSSRSCSHRGASHAKLHCWPKIYTKCLHCTVGGCFIFPPFTITVQAMGMVIGVSSQRHASIQVMRHSALTGIWISMGGREDPDHIISSLPCEPLFLLKTSLPI